MNLPDYFLADLPPSAIISPTMITQACQTLKRNRQQYLIRHSTQSLIHTLCALAGHWLEPDFPFRKLALDQGPAATGFSRATLSAGLDAFFRQVTRENLLALLEQDLGDVQRLDQMTSSVPERKSNRAFMATAPELLVQFAANPPTAILANILAGLVARSAQFVKCATGASLLPRLLAHSLYDLEPKMAACLEIAAWPAPSTTELDKALFEEADCVTAAGDDDTLKAIRVQLPARARFVGYGPRLSFAYAVGGSGSNSRNLAARAAADVAAWNQMAALGPHVIYLEEAGAWSADQFAAQLAAELARVEVTEPRGDLPAALAAAIGSRRAFYQVRAAHSGETKMWCSENSTAWTVVYESDSQFQLSCLHRFIYVKGVKELAEALKNAEMVRGQVGTVGLAAPEEKAEGLATELARWGVSRVCPLGQMQHPPLGCRHDGRPVLGDLVRWTDWEK